MQTVRNTARFSGLGKYKSAADSARLCKRAGGSPVRRTSSATAPKAWEHPLSSAVHLVFSIPALTEDYCLLHLEPGSQCRNLPKLGLPLPFSLSVCRWDVLPVLAADLGHQLSGCARSFTLQQVPSVCPSPLSGEWDAKWRSILEAARVSKLLST